MIPNGVTPADDHMAADIWGWSLGYWRDTKHWEKIPGLVLLREGGHRRGRVFSKEQLLAAHTEEERAKKLNVLPAYDLPAVPAADDPDRAADPDDLLDLEESLDALPAERRVALSTWKTYRYGDKTRLPEPDVVLGGKKADGQAVVETELWYRRTILEWDANRPVRGGAKGRGRPAGSKDRAPRTGTKQGAERRQTVRRLLAENNHLTAKALAEAIEVHPVHAERLLREARLEKVAQMLDSNPDLLVDDVQETLGLGVRAHATKLLNEARTSTTA
ncbi:hypothetical protein E5083_30885 [Streptomyces bauhiniae]|uniref:Uncharacterized protein n=1 Tax=Streptomyces bauhiniae TaxID=2340725 RepID=A0A4Z1CTK4_9ACTN|nr:hypothetical protein [Streptomyces bauhiniae]TGN72140.1 hypothetical protein E5083_30885 [Streptomyces bauhiniae]